MYGQHEDKGALITGNHSGAHVLISHVGFTLLVGEGRPHGYLLKHWAHLCLWDLNVQSVRTGAG